MMNNMVLLLLSLKERIYRVLNQYWNRSITLSDKLPWLSLRQRCMETNLNKRRRSVGCIADAYLYTLTVEEVDFYPMPENKLIISDGF